MTLVLFPLLTVALYYLGARAEVTRFVWSRYGEGSRLDRFMLCSACAGFWWGALVGGLGAWKRWSFLGLPGRDAFTVALVAVSAIVWTPLIAALHVHALRYLEGGGSHPDAPAGGS